MVILLIYHSCASSVHGDLLALLIPDNTCKIYKVNFLHGVTLDLNCIDSIASSVRFLSASIWNDQVRSFHSLFSKVSKVFPILLHGDSFCIGDFVFFNLINMIKKVQARRSV